VRESERARERERERERQRETERDRERERERGRQREKYHIHSRWRRVLSVAAAGENLKHVRAVVRTPSLLLLQTALSSYSNQHISSAYYRELFVF
jgi:hypothetical protein